MKILVAIDYIRTRIGSGLILLCLVLGLPSLGMGQAPAYPVAPPSDTRPCGTFSDYLIHNSAVNQSGYPQAHLVVDLMSSRYRDLLWVVAGYQRTGMPLVSYNGKTLAPPAPGDDPGLYYFVPAISRLLHMGIERTIDLVLGTALLFGFGVGFGGCLRALQSTAGKVIAFFAFLLLTAIAYHTGDVYVFEFATTVAVVPWVLYMIRRKNGASRMLPVWILTFGLICGCSSLIRFGSALPALTITGLLLLLSSHGTIPRKAGLILILLVGFVIPQAYLRHLLSDSDRYLQQNVSGYKHGDSRHVLGHFAYEGLGFLSNPYVPGGVCDEIAKDKVQAIAPGTAYMSSEYDRILRHEVISIARQHPAIVGFTILAKLGIVLGLIILFANAGFLVKFWHHLPWRIELSFWAAFALSAAPLILLAPLPMYCLGVISLAVVYGVISLDDFLAARRKTQSDAGPTRNPIDRKSILLEEASA